MADHRKARRIRQARLDRADDPRIHGLVAARPRILAFTIGSGRMGCGHHGIRPLGTRTRSLAAQDGTHAAQDGLGALAHGRRSAGIRLRRAATAPSTNIAPRRCAVSRTSSASSANSSTACASPRTRPSSISSWPTAATARRRTRRRSQLNFVRAPRLAVRLAPGGRPLRLQRTACRRPVTSS